MSNQIGWYTMKNQFVDHGECYDDLRKINCFFKKYEKISNFQGQLEILHKIKWNRFKNVVAIYDYYKKSQNELYVFMEKCDSDLSTYHQNLKEREKNLYFYQNLISQISKGYLELKSQQILHRDIKPDNILVVEQNGFITYKICDFDISKQEEDIMQTSEQRGTKSYSAPEIKLSNYSYAADMFSFGLTIFQLLAGDNNLNQSQNKLNSFYTQLQSKSFKEILIEQQVKLNIDASQSSKIIEILNRMIVYNPGDRISWEELNQLFFKLDGQQSNLGFQLSNHCITEQIQDKIKQNNFQQQVTSPNQNLLFNNNKNYINNFPTKNQNLNICTNIQNTTAQNKQLNHDFKQPQLNSPFQQKSNFKSAVKEEQGVANYFQQNKAENNFPNQQQNKQNPQKAINIFQFPNSQVNNQQFNAQFIPQQQNQKNYNQQFQKSNLNENKQIGNWFQNGQVKEHCRSKSDLSKRQINFK